jgi:hypothetical protein
MRVELAKANEEHRTISVAAIDPNPHRDLDLNPVSKNQIKLLVASINRTGFWDNVVVRPHSTHKGRYQLAYGHNRLAAVREVGISSVTLPVRDLSDWDMYCTMVEENETQQTITPQVAIENVLAGIRLVQEAFTAIGPEGTLEQFQKQLGWVVSTETTRTQNGHGFEQVRNGYFAGEGIGRRFLEDLMPGTMLRRNAIQDVLNSYYREQKEAKAKEYAAKAAAQATKAAGQAKASVDPKEKVRLEAEAVRKRKEAEEYEQKAKHIRNHCVDKDILMVFRTANQMTDFVECVRKLRIPRSHHQAAMKEVTSREIYGKPMAQLLSTWWYRESGQQAKHYRRIQRENAEKAFRRRVKDGDYGVYLRSAKGDMNVLIRTLEVATADDIGRYALAPDKLCDDVCQSVDKLIGVLSLLRDQLRHREKDASTAPVDLRDNESTKALTAPLPRITAELRAELERRSHPDAAESNGCARGL